MNYNFKGLQEIAFGALVAAALVLIQALAEWDPETSTDPKTWIIAVAGGAVRAAAGFIIARRVSGGGV